MDKQIHFSLPCSYASSVPGFLFPSSPQHNDHAEYHLVSNQLLGVS